MGEGKEGNTVSSVEPKERQNHHHESHHKKSRQLSQLLIGKELVIKFVSLPSSLADLQRFNVIFRKMNTPIVRLVFRSD